MFRVPFISCFALVAVASCSDREPVDKRAAADAAALPMVNAAAPTATGEPHGTTEAAKPLPPPAIAIPAAVQGRWGLTPAACMAGRPDSKGLLVVTAGALQFHESRAVPAVDVASDRGSISGKFAFTGDGRSWTKYEALKVRNRNLVRTEMNPTASFTYAKCV